MKKKQKDDIRFWVVIGSLGAMALAMVLIPLRELTTASNLAFVFLAFTIIIAELGGRLAALMTALFSAISLNFCLTKPYLTLTISKREDLIAFLALTACGLISAAFGKRRRNMSEVAGRAAGELDVLKKLVDQLRQGTSLAEILGALQKSFGLKGMILRDEGEKILVSVPSGIDLVTPQTQLTTSTLFPSDETRHRLGSKGFRLPEGGGRFSLQTEHGPISLDLWEDSQAGLSLDERRTLAIAALILLHEISHR